MNGIIVKDKVYEIAEWGLNECNDCDLQEQCKSRFIDENPYCYTFSGRRRITFRYSQPLTDKLNKQ